MQIMHFQNIEFVVNRATQNQVSEYEQSLRIPVMKLTLDVRNEIVNTRPSIFVYIWILSLWSGDVYLVLFTRLDRVAITLCPFDVKVPLKERGSNFKDILKES